MNEERQSDRLDSWKEIAAYLGKGVRTVQRWEASEGLPVRRLGQDRAGSVFAYRAELDEWWRQQSSRLSPEVPVEIPIDSGAKRPWRSWALIGVIAVVTVGLILAFSRAPEPRYGKPMPLTFDPGWESQPAISPDGTQVAYSARSSEGAASKQFILVKVIGGDSSRRLTEGLDPEGDAAWSPDGRMIAFVRYQQATKKTGIFMIPSGGGPESMIWSSEEERIQTLGWSPDGQWLLASINDKRTSQISAIELLTGKIRRLVEGSEFGYPGFGVTADGRRLIYSKHPLGPANVYELDLQPGMLRLGEPRQVTKGIWMNQMRVIDGGRSILYVDSAEEEGGSLWLRRLGEGLEPEAIQTANGIMGGLSVSADGRRIVYAQSPVVRKELWRLKLEGKTVQAEPVFSTTHSEQNPDYSPDGLRVAFHSTRTGASEIWVGNRDGSNARQLTHTKARMTATPRWSPDGSWIAYESNESGQSEVYLVRSNGGAAKRMTKNPATDAIPSWSRDGRWLYFCSNRTGRLEIWKQSLGGGDAMQVTYQGGFSAVESTDGKYLYYTRTRREGPLYRMPVDGGVPELLASDVHGLFFAVAKTGVYFQSKGQIRFWDAGSNQSRDIFRPTKLMSIGLAISPDEKELLFTQMENFPSDLYWIEKGN